MAKSSLVQIFSVSTRYGTDVITRPVLKIDTCQVVKKPVSRILFGTHLPEDAVKLAYIATPEISAEANLEVIDCSRSLNENSPDFLRAEELFDTKTFLSPYKEVLFTDEFTTGTYTLPAAPLYFKHILPATTDINSITILDVNSNEINEHTYKITTIYTRDDDGVETATIDSIVVYNSFSNDYDEDKDILTAYYVQYTYTSGGISYTKTELLNNRNIFSKATSDDLNPEMLRLKLYVKAYLVADIGNDYRFTLPQNDTTYSIKYLDQARIHLIEPAAGDKENPWFLQVTNGNFTTISDDGDKYIYDIPEFDDQLFNPIWPFKLAENEKGLILTPHILKLKREDIAFLELPVDIEIRNRDETKLLYALTTNTNKAGDIYPGTDISWNSDKVISYDSASGLIHIEPPLKDYYRVRVTYYYYEKEYEFTTLNFNPLFNTEMLDGFYVIYLRPRSTALGTLNQTASLDWLKVNSAGYITAAPEIVHLGGDLYSTFAGDEYSTWKTAYTDNGYLVLGEISVCRNASNVKTETGTRTGKIGTVLDTGSDHTYTDEEGNEKTFGVGTGSTGGKSKPTRW